MGELGVVVQAGSGRSRAVGVKGAEGGMRGRVGGVWREWEAVGERG